jgi:hypothetical protein
MSVARYPLAWPAGWPRANYRRSAPYKVDFDKAVRDLGDEIERLGGKLPIMSTNLELRIDGQPKQNARYVSDPGVAVYFALDGKQKVFACDTFNNVKDNIRSIGLTIESLRAIKRYGATDMLERALSAFDALPAPKSCWEVLGLAPGSSRRAIDDSWRLLAARHHPDRVGGSGAKMAEINAARDEALKGAAA